MCPLCSSTASVQNLLTMPMLCETKRTVVPESLRSYILCRALFLEGRVARGEGLVDDQDVGVNVHRDRETQPGISSR